MVAVVAEKARWLATSNCDLYILNPQPFKFDTFYVTAQERMYMHVVLI